MSVWLTIPSIRPKHEAEDCLRRWKTLGYKVAILMQGELLDSSLVDLQIPTGEYLGWPKSTNLLAHRVMSEDLSCWWVVGGGDDYWPIDRDPGKIAYECGLHFSPVPGSKILYSFGVMQPTGDRWGDCESARQTFGEDRGAIIDRVAGSPWMGREWIERAYQGKGPMPDCYHHLYADEELCLVAEKLGVYWRRPDLTQYHNHPARGHRGFQACNEGHLAPLYSKENWDRERKIFEERKAAGFPGSEPL